METFLNDQKKKKKTLRIADNNTNQHSNREDEKKNQHIFFNMNSECGAFEKLMKTKYRMYRVCVFFLLHLQIFFFLNEYAKMKGEPETNNNNSKSFR